MQLSEPYTIYTYRYFLHQWPKLCFFAYDGDKAFGTVVCKMDKVPLYDGIQRHIIHR